MLEEDGDHGAVASDGLVRVIVDTELRSPRAREWFVQENQQSVHGDDHNGENFNLYSRMLQVVGR